MDATMPNQATTLTTPTHGQAARRSISLVLPAWNEAEALPRAIAEADAALGRVADDYEILVVDDGSTDGTAQVVLDAATHTPAVRLVRHEANVGYGAALRSGFAAARCELVAFTDADNQFDLTELDRFVLLAERYQIVCGYRIDRKDNFLRRFYSKGYNVLVRVLLGTGVRDVDCALKMFHRDVIQRMEITTDGFLVNSELLTQAKQAGCSLVEVGVTHRARVEGTSTVSITHIPHVFADLSRLWWNRVQFPGRDQEAPPLSGYALKRINWASVALLVVAAVLMLTNIGYPLIDRDETRYAEIPREMVVTGNWVLPQLNFKPYYDKPPLMYWLCSASYTVFGVSEWSARLPQVLCALGTLALTLFFARRWFGPATGLMAALVLLVSVGFFGSSRLLLIDGLLTLLMTLSMGAAYEAIRQAKFRVGWWLVAALACGAGFLAKGPIAMVLLGPPVVAFGFLTNGASMPKFRHWALLGGVVAAMAAPWFIAVTAQQLSFCYEFFYKHHVTRFAGGFHPEPFWYFLPVLLVACHPWSFLLISFTKFIGGRSEEDRLARPPVLGYLTLWAGWCVLFFSISSCKLPSYIMPALPALAMLIGHYFQKRVLGADVSRASFVERVAPWNAALLSGIAGVCFAIFCAIREAETIPFAIAAGVIWLLVTVATQSLRWRQLQPVTAWAVCLGVTSALGLYVMHRELPQFARRETMFGPGSPLAIETAATGTPTIAALSHEWAEVPFYLDRSDIINLPSPDKQELTRLVEEKGEVLFLMRSKDDRSLLTDCLPDDVLLDEIGQRGRGVIIQVTEEPDAPVQTASKPANSIH